MCSSDLLTESLKFTQSSFGFMIASFGFGIIFTMFVFIVGVSTAFSIPRAINEKGKNNTLKKIIIRALSLYIIGLVYYGWDPKGTGGDQLRYVGVLQRIAICYLVSGLLFCFLNVRGLLIALFLLLIGYWALFY